MAVDSILLEGMVFFGHHGTIAAERELGQRFIVDVEFWCDLQRAGRTDDLAYTVDYSEVYREVRAIVEGEPVKLTETVAERIARAVLAGHLPIERIRVRVTKPEVRLDGGVLAGSSVQVLRDRTT